jgi:tripartite-type tricarboxylate transporter receptor subunit TctC
MFRYRRALIAVLAALLASAPLMVAAAELYPVRGMRFIVPQSPGAQNDIQARVIGQKLAEVFGQPVVMDNRPGAGGALGFEIAAQAPNDGYTLVLGSISTLSVIPVMPTKPRYDALKEFAPVTLISKSPYILVVHPSMPVHSVKELVTLAKKKPGGVAYATSGVGTGIHLTSELFNLTAGIKMYSVPYKGAAPATVDLLAGHVPVMFNNVIPAIPHVKSGRLRALAVTSIAQAPAFPGVPTIAESGYKGFESGSWQGVVTRAGVSPEVLKRLHSEIVKILRMPEVRDPIVAQGNEVIADTPQEFLSFIKTEMIKWEKVIKASGVTAG